MIQTCLQFFRSLYQAVIPHRLRDALHRHVLNYLHNSPMYYTKWVLFPRFRRAPSGPATGKIMYVTHMPRGNPVTGIELLTAKYFQIVQRLEPVFFFDRRDGINRSLYPAFGFKNFVIGEELKVRERTPDEQRLLDDAAELNLADAINLSLRNVPIGRMALVSARRVLQVSRISTADEMQVFYEKLAEAVDRLIVAEAAIDLVQPDVIMLNHIAYVEFGGLIFHLALARGIPTFATQERRQGIKYRHFKLSERWEHYNGLTPEEWETLRHGPNAETYKAQAQVYLKERMGGKHAMLPGQPLIGTQHQTEGIDQIQFPDTEKPIIAVFPHLPWDASGSHYDELFPSYRDWTEFTVKVAIESTDSNWIFRIHPSEATRGSLENTSAIIHQLLSNQNVGHIRVIEPEEPVSSYLIASHIRAGVTVRGSLCVELPCMGIPMICAGTGPTTIAGYNISPASIEEYRETLLNAARIQPLSDEQIEDAWSMAYGFFIYREVMLDCVADLTLLSEFRKLTPKRIVNDKGLQELAAYFYETALSPDHATEAATSVDQQTGKRG
jgi:hypothetical protein